jgi:uncharacterized membrane protein
LFWIPAPDLIALVLFVTGWAGYVLFATRKANHFPSLLGVMTHYRREWMARVVEREARIVDAALLSNLANGANFFASATLLILGGLVALLGTTEKVVNVVGELPFAARVPERIWEMKIFLLLGIFVYAFFKFTWSLRQYNLCAIMVGAAPATEAKEQHDVFINRSARLIFLAGENFNNGLRAYYFGLAALAWFLHPWLLVAATAWVIGVLYHREFGSQTLKALIEK